ncbi:hypothetical protein [Rathayibacter sp. VKM Ac-2630]|uniref:hypothetical protein n=1 Tax=Rathayibacter sp. VKM Ac-2630 TaxID=1938617 RepID=UPI0009820F9A|nr:hypothetical protein [Rathayibacter sp. VKM Ac-2630]OOB91220.1 hypothetical protein B0T42_07430 [Rathayibacter sp. VKM Ac-2630]
MANYDPEEHLFRLGVPVLSYPLRSANGLYVDDIRTVLVRPRLKKIHLRCVLAHEAAHAEARHRDVGLLLPRLELYADRTAARRLIDPDRLDDLRRWRNDPGEWCIELGVTPHLLSVYLDAIPVGTPTS